MLKKLLSTLNTQKQKEREQHLEQSLLREEARIGGQLFGALPKGHDRQFFCLDKNTWVWHEEWVDASGQRQVIMTRYEVRPSGVLKSQNGSHYQPVSPKEAKHLWDAANLYRERVKKELYSRV
jgi:hypothetical protein